MRNTIIKAVEAEYGEPFWDVVRGYAADGHGITATAQLLGYAFDGNLKLLMRRHGIQIDFKRNQETVFAIEARKERKGKPATEKQIRATQIASASNPTYLKIEYQEITDTLAGHCRRLGLNIKTVRNRRRISSDPEYLFRAPTQKPPPKGKGWQAKENRVQFWG